MRQRGAAIRYAGSARLCLALIFAFCLASIAAPQWRVRDVEFTGNCTFSRRALQNFMELKPKWPNYRVRYTDFVMRSDLEALRTFYRSRGFERAEVTVERVMRDSVKGHVRIYIAIEEGPRTHINEVKISADRFEMRPSDTRKLTVKPGQPLIHAEVRQDARTIKDALGNQGFLEAVVDPIVFFDSTGLLADVIYSVTEGPKITVGNVVLEGNTGVSDNVVRRELTFRQGDTLDLKDVRRSERRLYLTTLFNFVQVRTQFEMPVDTTAPPPDGSLADIVARPPGDTAAAEAKERVSYPDGTYDVRVRVTPGDFFRLQTGLGWSTDEEWRVSVLSSYRNLFRQGHAVTLDGKVSQISQRAEAIYYMPWILYLPLYLESKVYYNRYDNPELYQGVFDGVRFAVGRQTDYNILYQVWTQWENVQWVREPDSEDDGPDGLPDYPTQSIGGDISVDTRNDYFSPTSGSYHNVGVEVAGVFGGNSNRFVRVTFDTRWYFNYKLRYFWSSALRTGRAEPYGVSEIVPVQRRFSGGGSNTVRGFEVNKLAVMPNGDPLKGNFYVFANIADMRFPLFWWISGAAFLDAGNVWTNYDDIGSIGAIAGDLRWSAGPGIRIDTPIRLVMRLDLGFKLNRRSGESPHVWHFDLGQPF